MMGKERIGRQETAALVGLPAYVSAVLTLDSARCYSGGNSTYIWVPLAIALSLLAALFALRAMQRSGAESLDGLLTGAFGSAAGRIAALAVMALLMLDAYVTAAYIMNTLHSYAFFDSQHWAAAMWVMGVVLVLSFSGLECISRTTLIFAPLTAVLIAASLAGPADNFSLYRLYPLPGNSAREIAGYALGGAVYPFGAMAALLVILPSAHGAEPGGRSCVYGAVAAMAFAFATQFVTALTYGYRDLSELFFPLYRIDMMQVGEGYFLRMDALLLFVWLIAAMLTLAVYLHAASLLWCRCFGPADIRPAAAAFAAVLASALLVQPEGLGKGFAGIQTKLEEYGWAGIAPVIAAAAVMLVKHGAGRGARS